MSKQTLSARLLLGLHLPQMKIALGPRCENRQIFKQVCFETRHRVGNLRKLPVDTRVHEIKPTEGRARQTGEHAQENQQDTVLKRTTLTNPCPQLKQIEVEIAKGYRGIAEMTLSLGGNPRITGIQS